MRHRLKTKIILLEMVFAFSLSFPFKSKAETITDAYQQALDTYYKGNYQKAIEEFERIVALPMHDEDLFYNLGCAYFRMGQVGSSIYNFERAFALDKSSEDIKYNLNTARALVEGKVKDVLKGVAGRAWWANLVDRLSLQTWIVLSLVLWWIFWGVLFSLRFMSAGPARSGLIAANAFIGVLTFICGLLLVGRIYLVGRVIEGIILPEKAVVYEGPSQGTKNTFNLHAGLRVRIQSETKGWIRIRLANGLEGWLPRQDVGSL